MKSTRNQRVRVCGYCAAAPCAADGPFAAHMRCPGSGCACGEVGHIVSSAIAAVQVAYVGMSESQKGTSHDHR